MKRLLNEHTGTVHKPRPGTASDTTACGALRHVPDRSIRSIGTDETELGDDIDRCGRCFEDAGGY